MTTTLREVAAWVNGELVGDGDLAIHGAHALADAQAGDITFASDDKHLLEAHHSPATAVVALPHARLAAKAVVRVDDPLSAFVTIAGRMQAQRRARAAGVHPSAVVHRSAILGEDVRVEPFAVVGPNSVVGNRCFIGSSVSIGADCRIGDDVTIHPHVVLYDGTKLGARVIVHANSVIGADGFGYRPRNDRLEKVPHFGCVEIGDDVEIGACTTIDRGTFGATRIGEGTKIDNLVQIGHNCRIGRHNILVSQCGLAGSASTGDHVVLAGQTGVSDHVHVGAGAKVGAQSGMNSDVPVGAHILGSPALPLTTAARIIATMPKIPEMRRQLQRVLKHLGLCDE